MRWELVTGGTLVTARWPVRVETTRAPAVAVAVDVASGGAPSGEGAGGARTDEAAAKDAPAVEDGRGAPAGTRGGSARSSEAAGGAPAGARGGSTRPGEAAGGAPAGEAVEGAPAGEDGRGVPEGARGRSARPGEGGMPTGEAAEGAPTSGRATAGARGAGDTEVTPAARDAETAHGAGRGKAAVWLGATGASAGGAAGAVVARRGPAREGGQGGPRGTDWTVKSARNSKSLGSEERVRANGNWVSSKTTWREMMTRLVERSRHR
ncbi:circumsporozoite protein-like [Setaria italica]|uniref:circumsporozoite protein-like n=1 Tax=Setaria italica TaxID=4555 RepID=UPI000BE6047F|nr:circumsporozoite protein-like [Setaria italica]